MPQGRHRGGHGPRRRPNGRAVLQGSSILSICAGTVLAAHIGVFLVHSSVAGHALVEQERRAIAAVSGNATVCRLGPGPASDVGGEELNGLFEAPTLGLVAPVLQGTGDSVLNDAVGHDPASAWPGQPGTSVLSAHDVTWFSRIAQLKARDEVRYVTPCWTYTFAVTSHAVVAAGSSVYNTGAARLVLDTCYPLDAMYITSSRYLVYANLVGSSPTHSTAAVPGSWPVPAVPAPGPARRAGARPDPESHPARHAAPHRAPVARVGSEQRAPSVPGRGAGRVFRHRARRGPGEGRLVGGSGAVAAGIRGRRPVGRPDLDLRLAADDHAAGRWDQGGRRHPRRHRVRCRGGRNRQLRPDGQRDGQPEQAAGHPGADNPRPGVRSALYTLTASPPGDHTRTSRRCPAAGGIDAVRNGPHPE